MKAGGFESSTEIIALKLDLVAFINSDTIKIFINKVQFICHVSYAQKGEMLPNSTKLGIENSELDSWKIVTGKLTKVGD